jgi:hypothetical protein
MDVRTHVRMAKLFRWWKEKQVPGAYKTFGENCGSNYVGGVGLGPVVGICTRFVQFIHMYNVEAHLSIRTTWLQPLRFSTSTL